MELRCGVAGLGRGRSFVNWLNALPECEVVAVCDTKPQALEPFSGLKTFTDYEEFIWRSNLDVVAVITRDSAERLQLKQGDTVVAVIKSTEVKIAKE